LRRVCPAARAIFVIRNPVDVLNSLRQRFSLFGCEFHDDDFPRFTAELSRVYGVRVLREPDPPELEKGFLFWYYMNRFALESFARVAPAERPLVLCHDELVGACESMVRKICDFMAVPFSKSYVRVAQTRVGSVSRSFILAESERDRFAAYLNNYSQLLALHGIPSLFSNEEILGRYRWVKKAEFQEKRFSGLQVRALEREYESLLARLRHSQAGRGNLPQWKKTASRTAKKKNG
jgi:hypothetical protein